MRKLERALPWAVTGLGLALILLGLMLNVVAWESWREASRQAEVPHAAAEEAMALAERCAVQVQQVMGIRWGVIIPRVEVPADVLRQAAAR